MADPFPVVNELREQCPVAHSNKHGGFWLLTRHADVCSAAMDPERFCSKQGITIPHHGFPITLPPIECDPPQHREFRHPLRGRFGPKAMLAREGEILQTVTSLIDGFIERGEADLVPELAVPLPAIMASRLLGLPEEHRDRFRDWAVRILSVAGDTEVIQESFAYFAELRRDRLENPRDDIPSLMLGMQIEGRPMTEIEFLCMMNVLFTAGLDTTSHMSAYALEFIAGHPEHRQRLITDPDVIPAAVEELLRYITPLPGLARTTTEVVTVDGQTIPTGERVMLSWMGGNHDPEKFEDPETVDFDRKVEGHLAFGHGIHQCLGRHLARLELRVLLREILRRLPDYEIAQERVERSGGVTRGLRSLPVTFTPGERSGVGPP